MVLPSIEQDLAVDQSTEGGDSRRRSDRGL